MTIESIILLFSNLSPLVPICTGWKKKGGIWLYAVACLVFDINGFVLKNLGIERYWASNLFLLIELVLISAYFIRNVLKPGVGRAMSIFVAVLAVWFIVRTIQQGVLVPNYRDVAIFYGLYIVYSLLGLYKVVTEIEFVRIEQSPVFILSIAFLILASGTFIILLFEVEAISAYREVVEALWKMLHNPLNIIKNLLIGYGLWLLKKK